MILGNCVLAWYHSKWSSFFSQQVEQVFVVERQGEVKMVGASGDPVEVGQDFRHAALLGLKDPLHLLDA